jgi:hypothetical protein
VAGCFLTYQPSLRSKYVLGDLFVAAVGDYEFMQNTLSAEYRYWITSLITASLRYAMVKQTDTDLSNELSLNVGLATF